MNLVLADGTEITAEGNDSEIRLKVRPPGIVGGAVAWLDRSSCEELMRGLQAELIKAED